MEKVREAKYPFTISLKETEVKGRVCQKKKMAVTAIGLERLLKNQCPLETVPTQLKNHQ